MPKAKLLSPQDFVKLAISEDSFRQLLNSALHEGDILVGTDTHRLHVVSEFTNTENKTLLHLGKHCDLNGNPDKYPNWKRVVPETCEAELQVKVESFREFCLQVSKYIKADKKSQNRVNFVYDIENKAISFLVVNELGKAEFQYDPTFTAYPAWFSFDNELKELDKYKECKFIIFAINIFYLLDGLQVADKGTVKLKFTHLNKYHGSKPNAMTFTRPITITSDKTNYKSVIMPMQIDKE